MEKIVFGFLSRFLGLWFIAGAMVSLIMDLTKSIAASTWLSASTGQLWFEWSPQTLNAAQAAIQRHVSVALWDPFLQSLLLMPPWVLLGPLGLLLLWMGDKGRGVRTQLH